MIVIGGKAWTHPERGGSARCWTDASAFHRRRSDNPLIAASRFLPSRRRVVVDASTRQLTSLNAGQLGVGFGRRRFLSLGRAISGCCQRLSHVAHHVLQDSSDARHFVPSFAAHVCRPFEEHHGAKHVGSAQSLVGVFQNVDC